MNLAALQQSPFLQSLGWAIANSLWQSAALWVAYHIITGTYKSATAKFKTNTGNILLFLSFVWFCYTLFENYFSIVSNLQSVSRTQYPYNNVSKTFANAQWQMILAKIAATLPYLSVAYLLLLIALSIKLINSYRYTNFLKISGLQKPAVEWKLFTERVARHIGISKKIKLWVSHHIDVPATIGFFKPVILIPVASINQLSSDQLEAIILHELSHIKRNDYLINIFVSLVETILFFNPFIVLLAKIIKSERENCCDDFVIQYQYDRHSYASALLSLEQYRNIDLRLALSATSGKKQLLYRVKRIMEVKNNEGFIYGQKLVALVLITGIICSVAWLSPTKNESKQNEFAQKIIKPSYIEKVITPKTRNIVLQENDKVNDAVTLQKATSGSELNQTVQSEIAKKTSKLLLQLVKNNAPGTNAENVDETEINNDSFTDLPAFHNKQKTTLKNAAVATANFNKLTATAIQHLLTARQQNNIKTYFQRENLQNEFKRVMINLQNVSIHDKNLTPEQIKVLINSELKNIGETVFKPFPNDWMPAKVPSPNSCYIADTLFEKLTKSNGQLKTEIAQKIDREETYTQPKLRSLAIKTKPFTFNYKTVEINSSDMKNSPERPTTLRVAYQKAANNNSIVMIDGKRIKLADTDKVLTQLNEKKLSIISGDNIIEINLK